MSTVNYQCPCCGGPLAYGSESGKLECAACGNSFELEALEVMNSVEPGEGVKFDMPTETYAEGEYQAYICKSCGAELVTEGTTTATECPYCGSPTILPERIDGGVKPEMVVPFTVTKEQAQQQFNDYFKGKALLPNVFAESRNRISEIRKLYVPYWLFDCEARANIVFDAEKRHTERRGDWEIEHIKHYIVSRRGSMAFENIPVDGSEKLDNAITESLEPYDLAAAVPFQPAVLAGSMADSADVDAEKCEKRAVERVEQTIEDALRGTVNGYSSVRVRMKDISSEGGKVTPVLMPVWLITTEKEGKTYTFAINGQTGKLTCDVPADKKKSLLYGGISFALAFALAMLVIYLMEAIGTGTVLGAALVGLLAGLIVVSILRGQLKQAVSQSAAAGYVVKDSFKVHGRFDKYLYETTNRRKIQSGDKKN